MNNPRLTIDEWKIFDGKELVIYWEMNGTYIGKVKKVKVGLEGSDIVAITVTMMICFEIRMKGEETSPIPGSKRSDIEVTFNNPGKMKYGCDVATIVCSGSRLTVTNDPDVHEIFQQIRERYEEDAQRASRTLESPPSK